MKFLTLFVLAILLGLITVGPAFTSPRYEIVGISLGMTPQQVHQTIASKGSDWTFKEINSASGKIDTLIAARPTQRAPMVERIVVMFNEGNQDSWYVGRDIAFNVDVAPTVENLKKSLGEKYGPISWTNSNDQFAKLNPKLVWSFDPSGTQIKEADYYGLSGCVNQSRLTGMSGTPPGILVGVLQVPYLGAAKQ